MQPTHLRLHGRFTFSSGDVARTCLFVAFLFVLIAASLASAQSYGNLSVSGHITHDNAPSPAKAGDRVLMLDVTSNQWFGPAITDKTGWFAFYDLPAGRDYVICVYVGKNQISSNRIHYPGGSIRYDIELGA